jgi:hypothetical protein
MTPDFDKAKFDDEMLGYFQRLYGDFPEIHTKVVVNFKGGDNWNKNMSEAEIRQTVRILDNYAKGVKE